MLNAQASGEIFIFSRGGGDVKMNFYFRKILFFLLLTAFGAEAQVIEKVLAVVDDEMISLSYLESRRRLVSSRWAYPHVLFELRARPVLKKNKKQLLNYLIDEKIISSSIPLDILNGMEIPSPEKLLKEELKRKRSSRRRLVRGLKKIGMTLEEYKSVLKTAKIHQMWTQMEVASFIQISDQDINDYYLGKTGRHFFKKYKYEFYQWRFKHSPEEKKQAEELSQTGKPDALKSKGELKILEVKSLRPPVRKVISKMSIGQFSKPLCLGGFCYVFELLNKTFVNHNPKKALQIQSQLFKKEFRSKLKDWVKEKRQTSNIKIYI